MLKNAWNTISWISVSFVIFANNVRRPHWPTKLLYYEFIAYIFCDTCFGETVSFCFFSLCGHSRAEMQGYRTGTVRWCIAWTKSSRHRLNSCRLMGTGGALLAIYAVLFLSAAEVLSYYSSYQSTYLLFFCNYFFH